MINSILVGLDGSKNDEFTENRSIEIAKAFSGKLYGFHSYQAVMHRIRFENMEPTLSEKYQKEDRLNYLRGRHEDLINLGMEKISLGYLKNLKKKAKKEKIKYKSLVSEGRNYIKLIEEGIKDLYDLLIVGSSGMGNESFGTVAERVLWLLKDQNLLLIKNDRSYHEGPFAVCMDGSKYSKEALRIASEFAIRFNSKLFIVSAFDLNLHKPVFTKVKESLTEKEQKFFKFTDQKKLHDDIIDKGLEVIYESYLDDALELVNKNYKIKTEEVLLIGKAGEKIASWANDNFIKIIFTGRFGRHKEKMSPIGSTVSYISKKLKCDLFIVNENLKYDLEIKKRVIEWDAESEEELKKAPFFISPMIKKMVERYAAKKGIFKIDKNIFTEAKN